MYVHYDEVVPLLLDQVVHNTLVQVVLNLFKQVHQHVYSVGQQLGTDQGHQSGIRREGTLLSASSFLFMFPQHKECIRVVFDFCDPLINQVDLVTDHQLTMLRKHL